MGVRVRRGGPQDVAAVLTMFDGALVRYYESVGFTPTERFMVDSWPGQLLECRLPPRQGAVR